MIQSPAHFFALIGLIVLAVIIFMIIVALKKHIQDNDLPSDSIEAKIVRFIESMFLFAQKQVNWSNKEKMEHVVKETIETFPEEVGNTITEPVEQYVQDVYDAYTAQFDEYQKKVDSETTSDVTLDDSSTLVQE